GDAGGGTAIEHRPRIAQNAIEYHPIVVRNRFGLVSSLHRSAHDDIVVTAEYVHDPSVPAAAAEKVELPGQRPSEHHQVPASRDAVLVVYEPLGAIAGAVDDDVFSQLREIILAVELSPAKLHAGAPELGDEPRQQDHWVDQPGSVFAARHAQ